MTVTSIATMAYGSTWSEHAELIKANMTEYNPGRTFLLLKNDEEMLFITQWNSIDEHMKVFPRSKQNENILEATRWEANKSKLFLRPSRLRHFDGDLATVFPKVTSEEVFYSMTVYFMDHGQEETFKKIFEAWIKPILEQVVTVGTIGSGWSSDSEYGPKGFVVTCPWINKTQYTNASHQFVEVEDETDRIIKKKWTLFGQTAGKEIGEGVRGR